LQYISIEHAKKLLSENQVTLSETAYDTGLSSTSRLHDLFINIEGMTPAEYKNGGKNLSIHYSFSNSSFGNIIIASTEKGICHLAFEEDHLIAIDNLKRKFPNAIFREQSNPIQQNTLQNIPQRPG
jgi:AraC family transcriptional regulator, regulatory protein of adaptative response / methylated-DNA-[protein]-cysteine methyltransferase